MVQSIRDRNIALLEKIVELEERNSKKETQK